MKLSEYMELKNLDDETFGRLIGKERTTVLRYRHGKITPSLPVIAKIDKVTRNAVSFRDFLADGSAA